MIDEDPSKTKPYYSGRHCCLWCYATYDQMRQDSETREHINKRTLESIKKDLELFKEKFGGNLKHAKEANNIIDDIYFPIPIDQVHFICIQQKLNNQSNVNEDIILTLHFLSPVFIRNLYLGLLIISNESL